MKFIRMCRKICVFFFFSFAQMFVLWLLLLLLLLVVVVFQRYVGDMTAALDLKQLQEHRITHIITATNKMRPTHPSVFHYLV